MRRLVVLALALLALASVAQALAGSALDSGASRSTGSLTLVTYKAVTSNVSTTVGGAVIDAAVIPSGRFGASGYASDPTTTVEVVFFDVTDNAAVGSGTFVGANAGSFRINTTAFVAQHTYEVRTRITAGAGTGMILWAGLLP